MTPEPKPKRQVVAAFLHDQQWVAVCSDGKVFTRSFASGVPNAQWEAHIPAIPIDDK